MKTSKEKTQSIKSPKNKTNSNKTEKVKWIAENHQLLENGLSARGERSRGRCDTSGQSEIIRAEGDESESCMLKDLNETRGRRRRSQTCTVQFDSIDSANNHSAVQARLPAHSITSCAWSTMVFCPTGSVLTSGLRSHSWTLLSSSGWIIAALQKNRLDSTWAASKEQRSWRDFESFDWCHTASRGREPRVFFTFYMFSSLYF